MNPTDTKVAEALDKLDDDLNPIEDSKDTPPKADDKPEPPATEEPKTPQATDKPDQEEGYLADEGDDQDEPDLPPAPRKPEESAKASNLTPEQQYIYDNLPTISVRGADNRVYNVKVDTELPEDFDFATKAEERTFYRNLSAQELNARELQGQFNQTAQAQQAQDFEARENESIRQDVADLQREGLMPRFKVKVTDPKFDTDPATKQMQEVLDVMSERNEQYLKEYQQGRAYRHIGFSEAFRLWERTSDTGKQQSQQRTEDGERKRVADRTKSSQGLSATELTKPVVRSGTRTQDILARIDAMDI